MFKSFKDILLEIEKLYDAKDYNATVLESAKLTENALSLFFKHFHTFLNSKEEWQKYLQFERDAGEKFATFLRKPTIGVAIGYYNNLLDLFPSHPRINNEIRQYLNTINSIRNAHLHANQKNATADEAGRILDSLENILNKTNLIKVSTTVIGVPIKYYLVFTSIKEKFETAETDTDFKKIMDDSLKIMPPLLNILLNKVYHDLSTEMKGKLVDLFISSVDTKGENELKHYLNLCKVVDLEKLVGPGVSLRESLNAIESEQGEFSRRQTRHYVNIIEIIIDYSSNSETKHFLDFADAVKRKYLVRHKLTDNDRIILDEKAKDFKISKDLAGRIEESVISTIEKELILFKTLTYEKTESDGEKPAIHGPGGVSRKRVAVYSSIAIVLLAALVVWLNRKPELFTNYERAYFEGRYDDAEELARKARSISDTKAHFYYIMSVYHNNTIFPEEVKTEYRKLVKDHPDSPEARFDLGTALWFGTTLEAENDSAWILLDYARRQGVKGFEIDFVFENYYHDLQQSNLELALCNRLATYGIPLGLLTAGDGQLAIKYDTAGAIGLWRKAIETYPGYVNGYLRIAGIAIKKRDYIGAREQINKALEINPKNYEVISKFAALCNEEGKFDEAKKYYQEAIRSFGAEKKELYYGLLSILLQEDSVQTGLSIITESLKKFPKDFVFLNLQGQFKNRERWLKDEADINKTRNLLAWTADYDAALEASKKEHKPVLIDFYTSWCYWCKVLDKKVYPDSTVQRNLGKYILVKINAERNIKLANKYEVNAYPTLLVVENEGKKLFQLAKYVTPTEINKSLSSGLQSYQEYAEGKNITREKFTLVTNLNDAKIISRSKGVPIMLLVGDKRSTWSEKLINNTIEDPAFKNEFTQIIYLPVDKLDAPDYLKNYNISNYPTILFLDETGKEYFRINGFQPPKVLQKKVNLAKSGYKKEKIKAGINWYYDLDEAKSYALISKKNIYVAGFDPQCDPCNWMENETYTDNEIVSLLRDKYVCLHLENKVDKEVITKLGIEVFPAQQILKESGEEMFRSAGYKDVTELKAWLNIEEKVELLSVLGSERFGTFNEKFTVAKALMQMHCYQSALDMLANQVELLPDYYEIHLEMAQSLSGLKKYDDAAESYKKAIVKGAPITETLLESILTCFIAAHQLDDLESWLNSVIPAARKDNKTKSLASWISSKAFQISGDRKAALVSARNSITEDPSSYNGHLQYGRLLFDDKLYDQAQKVLEKAESLDKQNPVASFYLGLIAKKKGLLAEKTRHYNEATNRSGWAAGQVSYNSLAGIPNYYEYPETINLLLAGYDNFTELQNEEANIYYIKSIHLLLYKKEFDAALGSINRAMEVNPEAEFFKFVKAWILYESNNKNEGNKLIEEANKSFADNDHFPISDYVLGLYYLEKNDKDKAAFHFRRSSSYPRNIAWFIPIQTLAGNKLKAI